MIASPARQRLLWLPPIVAAAVLTLLASSTFVETGDVDAVPAAVDWVLGALAAPLVRDRGDLSVTITNLRLAGSYDASAGDALTLDRDRTSIDATSGFDLELVADDPNRGLSGSLQMDVLSAIDFGRNHDPASGQFSMLADGTTTLVTAQTSPAGVRVETGGAAATVLEWGAFRDAADDDGAGQDLRLASAAFNEISHIIELALLGEDVMSAAEDNRDTLEGMGLDQPLALTCDNLTGDAQGESVILWRVDAAGAGGGEIGAGDSLEARYENCRSAALVRYREGTLVIDDYAPARGDPPRTSGGQIDFGTLFVSEEQVTITTVPDTSSPRIDGGLDLLYEETVLEAP